jgi:glycosyltransferase involved in cell wall biosynthesis
MSKKRDKIGVGIITCNRPDYLQNLLETLVPCMDNIDNLVVINDGVAIDNIPIGVLLNNDVNIGVGKSKNKAMQHLLDEECEYIFIIEDDLLIKNPDVFNVYINASKETGIQHFNYGPGTPFNRKQDIVNYDLHNRHLLSTESKPNPKITIDYSNNVKIDLYEHIAGLFSFFTRKILEEVGLNDEKFYNAWEHVDHTHRIINHKGHPPFWWFADIHNSVDYLTIPTDSIDRSSTSNDKDKWFASIRAGRELYKIKHGAYPNMTPLLSKDSMIQSLKEIRAKWKI